MTGIICLKAIIAAAAWLAQRLHDAAEWRRETELRRRWERIGRWGRDQ
ncbi:MAG: hypothetical protein LBP92_11315 [Deltaproteobacteria bacterium]|jgi:hypothetical protein|nr:hypothetical protein [Deltaproteobacteria bacterium]